MFETKLESKLFLHYRAEVSAQLPFLFSWFLFYNLFVCLLCFLC